MRGPVGSNPLDDILNQDSEEWFGEPDPKIYAPGTRDLSPEEVKRELEKGNICRVGDFRRMLQNAYSWEKEAAAGMVLKHIMKERCAGAPPPAQPSRSCQPAGGRPAAPPPCRPAVRCPAPRAAWRRRTPRPSRPQGVGAAGERQARLHAGPLALRARQP